MNVANVSIVRKSKGESRTHLLGGILLDKVRVLLLVLDRARLERVLDRLLALGETLRPRREVRRGADDVVEHELRGRLELVFRVARVVDQVRVLRKRDRQRRSQRWQNCALTHSPFSRTRRASQVAAAAMSEGGAAMKRWSTIEISMRYLAMVRHWMS